MKPGGISAMTKGVVRKSEVRTSKAGRKYLRILVIVSAVGDRSELVVVLYFGKDSEELCRSLVPESEVGVRGKLQIDRWDADGEKRAGAKILADFVKPFYDARTEIEDGADDRPQYVDNRPMTPGRAKELRENMPSAAALAIPTPEG